MSDDVLDAVIRAAEVTASQATGNDQNDWKNFAQNLRVAKEDRPKPTPHEK